MLTGTLSGSASLVDALPYVDAGYDSPGVREAVLALVEEEMKVYRPNKDYLSHLPQMNLDAFQTDLMKVEMKRLDDGLPMEKLDFKKYSQSKPAVNRRRDPSAWEESFNRVAVLHNHMTNRLANLQLQLEYGPEVWRRYIPTVERQVKLAERELKDVRNRIQEVNWERKNSQTRAGQKLHELESRWVELIDKNFQIERSCLELESIIAGMERVAAEHAAKKANRATEAQVPNVDGTADLAVEVNHMEISRSESEPEEADQSTDHVPAQLLYSE
ncbi:putative Pre-mRNA-splicing factor SPF27 [Hypsibius exemplaris]|uniref:Pre-mRNA-splicing factor SPF27 n=1 Tax=Hypsibius exemplaris TaxID=2072580 RepID=A0A1W0XDC8_HYPEX|nr:putative Pre-mRNA-splicing factor SPF27 [Hypsibius exemplaris]